MKHRDHPRMQYFCNIIGKRVQRTKRIGFFKIATSVFMQKFKSTAIINYRIKAKILIGC